MLTYLSGLRKKVTKAAQKRAVKKASPARKKLFAKKTTPKAKPASKKIKAKIKKAIITRAKKNNAIIKKIAIKKPILASKIKKAQAQRAIKRTNKRIKADTDLKNSQKELQSIKLKALQNESFEDQSEDFNEPSEEFETSPANEVEDFENTSDFEDSESEDSESEDSEIDNFGDEDELSGIGGFSSLGFGGKLFKKRIAKKTTKAALKNKKKATKPRNLRKAETAKSKAAKRRATGESRLFKSKKKGGNDTINKLISKGGEILENQINKRTGGGEQSQDIESKPMNTGFFDSIPKPVLYIGGAGLALAAIAVLKPKNK